MESKICRICLNNSATISIFEKQEDMQLSTKIMRCASVVIVEGDGLPDAICVTCAAELYTSYDFASKCEASDKALRDTKIVDLFDDVLTKTEPVIKVEDIKLEAHLDDNDHFDNVSMEEHQESFDSDDKTPDYSGIKLRRKYTKTKKFREGVDRRRTGRAGPFKCGLCSHLAASRSALEGHMRTHTGEKPFRCQHCDARFNLKGSLKRHVETHHTERERKYICESCGNGFMTKNCIITHMRVHTDERPYPCPFCPKAFRQIASMIRHKRLHTGERPYTCPICYKTFADKSHMMRHQVKHSSEKKFSCLLCNKAVKTKNALKTHMTTHSNEKHNICSYCGMTFSLKGNLQVHIKRKHSERSGECIQCKKTFSDLALHMRKHTGEKPFACDLCDQAFISKNSLSNHVGFKHKNVSKFKCSIGECTKTFPAAKMLEFHLLKYHTNHTPYICHHCSRGFFRTSDLSRHLKMSHMETAKLGRKQSQKQC